jgi:hypothetical protein
MKEGVVVKTKTGIVVYKTKRPHYWAITFPDGSGWYGGINTAKLISLFFYLGEGYRFEIASRLAGFGRRGLKKQRK